MYNFDFNSYDVLLCVHYILLYRCLHKAKTIMFNDCLPYHIGHNHIMYLSKTGKRCVRRVKIGNWQYLSSPDFNVTIILRFSIICLVRSWQNKSLLVPAKWSLRANLILRRLCHFSPLLLRFVFCYCIVLHTWPTSLSIFRFLQCCYTPKAVEIFRLVLDCFFKGKRL